MSGAFGKLYRKLWDGTLGPPTPPAGWQVLAFILPHANHLGVLDMTPQAIANRSGMALLDVQAGIAILEAPDPESRTEGEEGRRIVRLDEHRTWGWRIVNYAQYREAPASERSASYRARNAEELRDSERERSRNRREEARSKSAPGSFFDPTATRPSRTATDRHHAEAEAEAGESTTQNPLPLTSGVAPEELLRRYREGEEVAARVIALGNLTEFARLPLKGGTAYVVSVADVVALWELYPTLDVAQSVRSMLGWLMASPSERKTRRGIRKFMVGWLNRELREITSGRGPRVNQRAAGDESYAERNLGEES